MNILYLTYDGLTDSLGQSQILPYVIGLSNKGISFTIVSFEKPHSFKDNRNTVNKIILENSITWVPINYTKRPPFFSTIYDIYKLKKKVKQLVKKEKVSIIHCRSYITALIGLWVKRKYNIPFVFDMRGFWADERVEGKIWDLNKIYYKKAYNYFKTKEKEFLQEAAYTISLTNNGQKEISSWRLKNLSPIKVIPCCTDEALFNLEHAKKIDISTSILPDDFIISYLGSIGTWYMLEEMLDFFKELLFYKNNAKFLFITKDNPAHILSVAKKKGISLNKIIIESSSRDKVPSYLALSNYAIFFINPVYSKKASSPTKMGEIMNLGIPIICNGGVGDVDLIMGKSMPELMINEFNTDEYNRVINIMLNHNLDTDKIKTTASEYYSLKRGVKSYLEVYNFID